MSELAESLGRKIFKAVGEWAELFMMVYFSAKYSFRRVKERSLLEILRVILTQIYFTGTQGVPLLAMLGLIIGSVAVLQAVSQVSKIGGAEMMGNMLVVLILREIGPLVTVLVVIARSGTAVASELGNMKVNSEITLLESVGINPLSYIVFPRILGGVLSVLCLGFTFCMVAFFGGYFVVSLIHPLSFEFYSDALAIAITRADVILFLLKNSVSGLIIFSLACFYGLSVKKSFTEVPQMTTKAVMSSIVYTVTFNGLVSLSLYLQNLKQLGVL